MIHRSLAIGSLTDFKLFKGTLLSPAALLLSKLDRISRNSFLVQGDIRNESTQGLVRYQKGLKVCLIVDLMFGATEQTKLLKLLEMTIGLVRTSPVLLTVIFRDQIHLFLRTILI